MNYKKLGLFTTTAVMLTSVVAGCGSDDAEAKDGKKVVRVATWEGEEGLKTLQGLADDFMKENPDVTIKCESAPDSYTTKLLTQVAAGDAPDIFQIGDGDIKRFKDKGALADITKYVEGENGLNMDEFLDTAMEIGQIDGKYYTLPKDFTPAAVFYNKALFDEAGVPYPTADWTWEEFHEIGKKLTKKDGDKYTQWGIELPDKSPRNMQAIFGAYGGLVLGDDGKTVDGVMNSESNKKAAQLYQDMYVKSGVIPSSTQADAFKGMDLFETGKIGMKMNGMWNLRKYEAAGMDFGVVPMPQGTNGSKTPIYYAGYAMSEDSKVKDEAWDFLKYLSTKGQEVLVEYALTAYKPVGEEKGQLENLNKKVFVDSLENIMVFPEKLNYLYSPTAGKELQDAITDITTDASVDVSKRLDEAAKKGQKSLDKETENQ